MMNPIFHQAIMVAATMTYFFAATGFCLLFGVLALAGNSRSAKAVGIAGLILILSLTAHVVRMLP